MVFPHEPPAATARMILFFIVCLSDKDLGFIQV
jgi:hypothetical protein